jgi:hypothetical protein
MSSNSKISEELLAINNSFDSQQEKNSLILPSMMSRFETLFMKLIINKKDIIDHFSDSLNFNLGKIFDDKILLIDEFVSTLNANFLKMTSTINSRVSSGMNKIVIPLKEN